MQKYEIRILRPDGRAALITAQMQWNDDAAIHYAKQLARGRNFEVWRGMDCICGLDPLPASRRPPDRPAA
jgi:hypothetical protein